MILSIYGRNQSGKTTLANMLVDECGFIKISFADALRKLVKSYFGIDTSWKVKESWDVFDTNYFEQLDKLFSVIEDKKGIKEEIKIKIMKSTTRYAAYRTTLEMIGTEVVRDIVIDEIWVAVLAYDILYQTSKGNNIVIDDMRFKNEYNLLKKLNAKLIRITSPFEEADNGHRSQKYIEKFKYDYIIENNKTKKVLLNKFKELKLDV